MCFIDSYYHKHNKTEMIWKDFQKHIELPMFKEQKTPAQALLVRCDMQCKYTPKAHPDLNGIEYVWAEWKLRI